MKAEIAAYLEKLPPERKEIILTLRQLFFDTVDQLEESFQYRMPTYIEDGHIVVALASQKHYLSLYFDVDTLDNYRDQFSHLDCGKSCVRFRKLTDLPLEIVKAILTETMAQNAGRV